MAKKGTYSAYQTQPPVQSGQFAGAGAFARMAQVNNQKRAEERAEQRQLKQEYKTALNNAVEAGNLDFGEINKSMHGIVGKVLNNYGDKMASMMEGINEDYSFERQMEIARLKQDFQGKVGTLMGISNAIETYSSGEWDNVMSVQSKNQLMSFLKDLPSINENFDGETLAVGGKRIDQLFRERVDASGFIEEIDAESVIGKWGKSVKETGTTKEITQVIGGKEVVVEEQTYNTTAAREKFTRVFNNTQELAKLKRSLLIEHQGIENEAVREDFEANYMTIGDDGEAYVTEDGVFNYLIDTEIEPSRYTISEKPYDVNQMTAKQRQDAFDEMMSDQNILRNLNEARTNKMTGLEGHDINVDGLKGKIVDGGISYNPFTGEPATSVKYVVDDEGSLSYFHRFYDNDLVGLQELGHHVYDDKIDYRALKEKVERETGQSFNPPVQPITFEDREKGINNVIDHYRHSFEIVMNTRMVEEDLRNAAERAWGLATETHPETGTVNKPLINFMADYLGANKAKGLFGTSLGAGKAMAEGYGLTNYGIKLDQQLDLTDGDLNKQAEAEKLGKIVTLARSLKADGVDDKEVAKRLVQAAKEYEETGDINFEYDRVKRKIGNDVEKINAAKSMLQGGLNDAEIMEFIDIADKVDTIAIQQYNMSSSQMWRSIKEAANNRNMTIRAILEEHKIL